ncbi:hypothetical protein BDV93DRAFT_511671 [Ceratobasidium sp. AG-I]|nr:hypothetical protein BDV93DRAFT_511671 [Ceratobasidium sp. AG-I]
MASQQKISLEWSLRTKRRECSASRAAGCERQSGCAHPEFHQGKSLASVKVLKSSRAAGHEGFFPTCKSAIWVIKFVSGGWAKQGMMCLRHPGESAPFGRHMMLHSAHHTILIESVFNTAFQHNLNTAGASLWLPLVPARSFCHGVTAEAQYRSGFCGGNQLRERQKRLVQARGIAPYEIAKCHQGFAK